MAVPSQLSSLLRTVLSAHPEVAVGYLFGSRARGAARDDSDVDVGLVFRRGGGASAERERVALQVAAEVSRATDIDRVDVVDLEEQGPIFCHQVLLDGERVFEADRARRIDFESDSIVRAFDFRPTYELATRGKIAALRRWLRRHHDVGAASVEARRAEGEPR